MMKVTYLMMKSSGSHYRYTIKHTEETTTSNDLCIIFPCPKSIKTWSGNLTNVFVLSFCSCLC